MVQAPKGGFPRLATGVGTLRVILILFRIFAHQVSTSGNFLILQRVTTPLVTGVLLPAEKSHHRGAISRDKMPISSMTHTDVTLAAAHSSREVPHSSELLHIEKLCVEAFQPGAGPVPVLNSINFTVFSEESIGILGESGCGKTTLSRALMGILPTGLRMSEGSITFESHQLVGMPENVLRGLRGDAISLIHQEAEGALHPLMRVRDQIAEIFRAHRSWSYEKCLEQSHRILAEIFSENVERVARAYPHELSGGQRQRVLIAQAIACRPRLVIADEPTASLDTSTQAEIVSLLGALKRQHHMALILITHNPAILRALADRIIVMYAGRVVEDGPSDSIFATPLHPYTQALLGLERRTDMAVANFKRKLATLDEPAPDRADLTRGCAFEPRCSLRRPECAFSEPDTISVTPDRMVRCVLYEQ
jgi:oligopeptide/dipeptide ABC transporter ATP-binding protein